MKLIASKEYREKRDAVISEMKAPRKIIGWLILLEAVNFAGIVYLILR